MSHRKPLEIVGVGLLQTKCPSCQQTISVKQWIKGRAMCNCTSKVSTEQQIATTWKHQLWYLKYLKNTIKNKTDTNATANVFSSQPQPSKI